MASLPTISERYVLEEEVGRGGMAVVYRAHDRALNRVVAVKVLHAHLQTQADSRSRLTREAQAVAKLHHPNIVEIHDYSGEDAETAFIVTELIDGETLETFLLRRRLELPETALLLVAPICEALAHAHALGIVHRDIKPGNVMIRKDGTVKLMDFGIAQVLDAQGLTMTGTLLGSPAHMSPEHIEGRPLDARADVFSLGTLLYLAAVGELPFQGRNPHALMRALLECDVRPPEGVNPRVSSGVARLLMRMLAREPVRRHGSVDEVLGDVRAYLSMLGLHDLGRELREFLAMPATYEAVLGQRLVAARIRRGKEALLARRHAEALEHFNQVLVLEPGNAEVTALLARLGRRRAVGRVAVAASVFVLIGGLAVWLGIRGDAPPARSVTLEANATSTSPPPQPVERASAPLFSEAPPPPPRAVDPARAPLDAGEPPRELRPLSPRQAATVPPTAPRSRKRRTLAVLDPSLAPAGAASVTAPQVQPTEPAKAPRELTPPSPSAPATAPETTPPADVLPTLPRTLRINTWPKAVRISIDGREIGWAGIVKEVNLAPGTHLVRLDSPSCHPQELTVRVPADGPVPPLVARLRWRPGLLVVRSAQNPDVAVDGVYKGVSARTAKEPILVALEPDNRTGRVKVHVRMSKLGFQPEDRVVEVAAGRTATIDAALQPQ